MSLYYHTYIYEKMGCENLVQLSWLRIATTGKFLLNWYGEEIQSFWDITPCWLEG